MSNPVYENMAVMPEDFVVSVKDVMAGAEVTHRIEPIDKIRVVLYKGDKIFDSFSFSTKPKSKLLKNLVIGVGTVISKRNEKRSK